MAKEEELAVWMWAKLAMNGVWLFDIAGTDVQKIVQEEELLTMGDRCYQEEIHVIITILHAYG